MTVGSHVTQIASVAAPRRDDLEVEDFEGVDDDPVRCLDPETRPAMVEEINVLRKRNEASAASSRSRVFGLVPGLGSHISWEDRLDGRLAQAICSIQSIKGASIGEAWDVPAGPAPRPTTRSSTPRSAASTGRPTAPAGSKAA